MFASEWASAAQVLPHLAALILSYEDLTSASPALPPTAPPPAADSRTARWARAVPVLVVTRGAGGADLWQGAHHEHFPAFPAREVDPTGAGDVFAAAFLCRWHDTGDPRQAVIFAHRTAAFAVERAGMDGIPTLADVLAHLASAS